MPFTSLHLCNVGPFKDIEFVFNNKINVFVGPNNCGKTTTLSALGDIAVYPFDFPEKFLRSGDATFEISHRARGVKEATFAGSLPIFWKLSDEELMRREVDQLKRFKYTCFVPALRRGTDYRSKGPGSRDEDRESQSDRIKKWRTISSGDANVRWSKALMLDDKKLAIEPELLKRRELFKSDPSLITDEAVIQKIIDVDYKAYREAKPGARKVIEKIAEVASEITEGFPIRFSGVGEDKRGLFPKFVTPDGDLPFNVLSQGTQSIMQWIAHFLIGYAEYYEYRTHFEERPGTLIIDEIDAHLHPSWQMRILPTLLKHFPQLQIFCSTHSPLMLAGLEAGQIQLLNRDVKGNVTVSTNEFDVIGWSVDEILSNVQNVPNPTDLETQNLLQRLNQLRRKRKHSANEKRELTRIRDKLEQSAIPDAAAYEIERMATRLKKAMGEPASNARKLPRRVKRKS